MGMKTFIQEDDVSLLLDIANMACHRGYPGEARTIIDGVLAIKPDFIPAKITLAYSHLVVDEFNMALDILDPIIAHSPTDADARLMQGLTLLLAKRNDEAATAFAAIPDGVPQKSLAEELVRAM